jgi:isopentenyl phosphate kinase
MLGLKLGGSVITNKRGKAEYCKARMEKLAQVLGTSLAQTGEQAFIIHGAGSFGHPYAKKYSLHTGFEPGKESEQLGGFSLTHNKVRKLNLKVLNALFDAGLKPVSISPFDTVENSKGKIFRINAEPFRLASNQGLTPLTFGDVVFDNEIGCSICSGDDLAVSLAGVFRPRKFIFVVNVDGIFSSRPGEKGARLIRTIDRGGLSSVVAGGSGAPDVTRSMEGKIEAISQISKICEVDVLNGKDPFRLGDAIFGKKFVGTVVRGENE